MLVPQRRGEPESPLDDLFSQVIADGILRLPFDPMQIIDNLRWNAIAPVL
jgi:hypothetical protein